MTDFNKLNKETWLHNNIGNQHHYSNTGIKHPTNFNKLNAQTYYENNYKQHLFHY